jgi:hypothetical protein
LNPPDRVGEYLVEPEGEPQIAQMKKDYTAGIKSYCLFPRFSARGIWRFLWTKD